MARGLPEKELLLGHSAGAGCLRVGQSLLRRHFCRQLVVIFNIALRLVRDLVQSGRSLLEDVHARNGDERWLAVVG